MRDATNAEGDDIVITGMARTPFGSSQGQLSCLSAPTLGSYAIKQALKLSQIAAHDVSEVFMGNVLEAGLGQAPARQAALHAGIPVSVPCTTINKVCGSGMQSIIFGIQALLLDRAKVVVSGGMENMSLAPFLLEDARKNFSIGNHILIDSMIHDGLWDAYVHKHMGSCAEACAEKYQFTRQMQDNYAALSYRRAQQAQQEGLLSREIVPVVIKKKDGTTLSMAHDEGPDRFNFEKMQKLKPAFEKTGTITAANSSSINDGAAAVVLMRASTAKRQGIQPLGKIVAYDGYAHDPTWFTTAPIHAMEKALSRAGWKIDDVDLFEVNEAFAVVALAAQQALKIPIEKYNIWGGAIAYGHPIGASAARLVITLLSQLNTLGKKKGLASICIGGGEALAICVESMGGKAW